MIHNCPICSSITRINRDKTGRIYHFCDKCLFAFLNSEFLLNAKEEKERYELHHNTPHNHGYREWLNGFILEAVEPFLKKGQMILDFGCGPYPLLQELLIEKGYVVDVFDKFFSKVKIDKKYDMITSTEVLEHIEKPFIVLEFLKSKLKAGGLLAIKTSFRPLTDRAFLNWWYKEDSTHISFFTYETFKNIAKSLEIEIVYCDKSSIIIFRC